VLFRVFEIPKHFTKCKQYKILKLSKVKDDFIQHLNIGGHISLTKAIINDMKKYTHTTI